MFNKFIVHYGIPQKIHRVKEAHFEGQVIEELCKIMNMKTSRTTPLHLMGNELYTMFNCTLLQMLGTLNFEQKTDWKSYIVYKVYIRSRAIVHAYDAMKQESTQQSPFYLMFGRRSKLTIEHPILRTKFKYLYSKVY